MIIESTTIAFFKATGVTICPFIFIATDLTAAGRKRVLVHEWVHWWQQFVFGVVGALIGIATWMVLSWPLQPESILVFGLGAIEGWVAGQLLWRWLYLVGFPFGLPFWYNWFRRRWETAAYRANGLSDSRIDEILQEPPYYLVTGIDDD